MPGSRVKHATERRWKQGLSGAAGHMLTGGSKRVIRTAPAVEPQPRAKSATSESFSPAKATAPKKCQRPSEDLRQPSFSDHTHHPGKNAAMRMPKAELLLQPALAKVKTYKPP
jgi:hypothetical protein